VVWWIGMAGPATGVACQRQHWASHKRQCRALAEDEYRSTFHRRPSEELQRIINVPGPSDIPLLLKFSAITWTIRPGFCEMHVASLNTRSAMLNKGRPAPGDTKEGLVRLLKRAVTELSWSEIPGRTDMVFKVHLPALSHIAEYDSPEAALEILSRHVEDVERKVVAPSHMIKYYVYRLDWLLLAAKVGGDEGKRGAYVAEAKGLMGRATRSLRGLQSEDWKYIVRASTSPEHCLSTILTWFSGDGAVDSEVHAGSRPWE
jgi:hypothetical protein